MHKMRIVILAALIFLTGCSNHNPKTEEQSVTQVPSQPLISKEASPQPVTPIPTSSTVNESSEQPLYAYDKLIRLDMVSMDTGYAQTADSHILKSLDGGKYWTDIYTLSNTDSYMNVMPNIAAVNKNTLYIAAYVDKQTTIISTVDGGVTWKTTAITSEIGWLKDDISGYHLAFADADHGYLMVNATPGAGMMFKALYMTSDAGVSWEMITCDGVEGEMINPSGIGGYPNGIAFSDADLGWAMCTSYGPYGIWIYQTSDGGATWSMADLPQLPEEFSDWDESELFLSAQKPSFYNENNGKMIIGFTAYEPVSTSCAYIYSLDNSGNWIAFGKCNKIISSYEFMDSQNGFGIDSDGKLYQTEDGGLTWNLVNIS